MMRALRQKTVKGLRGLLRTTCVKPHPSYIEVHLGTFWIQVSGVLVIGQGIGPIAMDAVQLAAS